MILKPPNQNNARKLLADAGLIRRSSDSNSNSEIADLLDSVGASKETALRNVADLASFGETESVKLAANKQILELHGVVREESNDRQITVNIINTDNANFFPVLCPE